MPPVRPQPRHKVGLTTFSSWSGVSEKLVMKRHDCMTVRVERLLAYQAGKRPMALSPTASVMTTPKLTMTFSARRRLCSPCSTCSEANM